MPSSIAEKFGDVRDCDPCDPYSEAFKPVDEDVVKIYKPDRFAPIGREATAFWANEGMKQDIGPETTDARIAELVAVCEAKANSNGYTLDSDLERLMQEYRQELRESESLTSLPPPVPFRRVLAALVRASPDAGADQAGPPDRPGGCHPPRA